jgi:phage/plasmid-like protein (TIGR03299 family)
MAALLDMSNGRANMAFIGATPWHGDGERMPANATIEDWVRAAGMAYKVKRAPVQFTNGSLHTYAGKDVLYRDDTNMPLGVVSEGYKIVQPDETIEFFRDLCEQQDMTMETAGVLKGGAVYWALARTGHTMDIDRDAQPMHGLLRCA